MLDKPGDKIVSVWQSFKDDRVLLGAFLFFTALVAAPLFLSPFLPLQDLPDHTGLAALMGHVLSGGEVSSRYYQLQYFPVPYWTVYSILSVVGWLVAPTVAAKVLFFVAVVSTPVAVSRLALALRQSPRVGLCGFAFAWDYNVSWGFLAHVLGFAVALVYLARTIEMESRRDVLRGSWLGVLLALTHAHATLVWMAAAAVTAVLSKDRRQRLQLHALAAVAPLVTMLPWIISRIAARAGGRSRGPSWPSMKDRFLYLFDHTFFTFDGPIVKPLLFAVFVILFFGPPLLAVVTLKRRRQSFDTRLVWGLYALAWLLYLVAPSGIWWPINQQFIYQRQASFIVLVGLFLPGVALEGRRIVALMPALAATATVGLIGIYCVADFGTRSAPFTKIIEAIAPESSVLTLTLDDRDKVSRRTPYNQFHAYIVAKKGGYDPYLFNNPSHPIVFRRGEQPAHPRWNEMQKFSMTTHAPQYNFIVVQGLEDDPVVQGPIEGHAASVKPVLESGRWRLYRVEPL
jgi:hypothetical protein